ncbi:hypothetical protein [Microbacterium sp. BK668]|uniref:hypothetical protein n=1 Tax=Microbacterium sp. BK668 TaxID=2512118 RepID=UPI00105B88A8|nr:hypothetical protein [Microbacterium sp. BK668]TDN90831.1 hypothetical protein EV279_0324 [Microbacterium sp. BK668]
MSDTGVSPGRGAGWMRWIGFALAGILVVALTVWAFMSFRPASEAGAAAPTPSATRSADVDPQVASPTPQPTEFPAPAPGATDPVSKPESGTEVPLDQPATAAGDVVVEVTSLEPRSIERSAPGEPSGPALAVTVRISNNGADALDTSGANVSLEYGGDDRIPAVAVSGGDSTLWPSSVAAGATSSAVFVFSKPEGASGDIRVIVDLLATEPDVVFVGPEP